MDEKSSSPPKSVPSSSQEKTWVDQIKEAAERENYDEISNLIRSVEHSPKAPDNAFNVMSLLFSKYDDKNEEYVLSPYYQQLLTPLLVLRLYDLAKKVSQSVSLTKKNELFKMMLAVLPTEKIKSSKRQDIAYCAYRFFLNHFIENLRRDKELFGLFYQQLKNFRRENINVKESQAANAFLQKLENVNQQLQGEKLILDGRIVPAPKDAKLIQRIQKVAKIETPARTKTRRALYIVSCIFFLPMAFGEGLFPLKDKIGEKLFPGKTLEHRFFRRFGYVYAFLVWPEKLIKAFPQQGKLIRIANLVVWVAIICALTPMLGIPVAVVPYLEPLLGVSKQQLFMLILTTLAIMTRFLLRWSEERMPNTSEQQLTRAVTPPQVISHNGNVRPKKKGMSRSNSYSKYFEPQPEKVISRSNSRENISERTKLFPRPENKKAGGNKKALASFQETEADIDDAENDPLMGDRLPRSETSVTDMFKEKKGATWSMQLAPDLRAGAVTPADLELEGHRSIGSRTSSGSGSGSEGELTPEHDGRFVLPPETFDEGGHSPENGQTSPKNVSFT